MGVVLCGLTHSLNNEHPPPPWMPNLDLGGDFIFFKRGWRGRAQRYVHNLCRAWGGEAQDGRLVRLVGPRGGQWGPLALLTRHTSSSTKAPQSVDCITEFWDQGWFSKMYLVISAIT
jgi:hypothetical protein